ncbi:MAG: penicillin acylase family protein [Gemmataceae bacterium]
MSPLPFTNEVPFDSHGAPSTQAGARRLNPTRFLFRLLLGQRLPTIEGQLTTPGVHQPILIRRDRWGIPSIQAENDHDAWYGLGFCHGQDRTFQLESLLRVIRGTLAELVGPDGLVVDRLVRRIGFIRAAKSQLPLLAPEVREMIDAYAAGATAGGALGLIRRPHEFVLLRSEPTPWTALDVLGLLKLLSFSLVSNWDAELARHRILTLDGPTALKELEPEYADWLPVTSPPAIPAGPAFDCLAANLAAFQKRVPLGGGSNNWALGSKRTRTGRPILANDPHLPGVLPPHWYLAHIHTPTWQVSGASFVGGPTFPAGHNAYGAWGVTVGLVDNTDLFLEELGPDRRSVRQGEGFIPCEVQLETIAVKGATSEQVEVLITPRGPIISPALDGIKEAYSMRATWLEPLPIRGLLAIHKSTDFQSFRQCLAEWPGLAFNMVYADTKGNYGWQMMGLAPRRKSGYGTLPLPGWVDENGWHDDPVPFDEMPWALNPGIGFLATANNKPVQDGEGPFLSADFADGYRCAAIVRFLAESNKWDITTTQALQLDQTSLPWQEIRDLVVSIPVEDEAAMQGLEVLQSWDGKAAADSPGAAVFELFTSEMMVRFAKAVAPKSYEWALGKGSTPLAPVGLFGERRVAHIVERMRRQPPGIFSRSWSEEMAAALKEVIIGLRALYGNEPANWAWGYIRPLILRHPLGRKKPFDRVFNLGPIPMGGDANTIPQATVTPLHPTGDPAYIPSLRMVVDVGNWSASRFILASGQSGNPLSPHYADQLPLWERNEGLPIAWTEEDIQKTTVATLKLLPEG